MKFIGLLNNFINTLKNLLWNFLNKKNFFYYFYDCLYTYIFTIINIRKNYHNQILDSKKIIQIKKNDTIFIFGAGSSINDISKSEWKKFSLYDTLGFNGTLFLKKIKFTFQLNRQLVKNTNRAFLKQLDLINKNKFLNNAIFLMPKGLTSSYTNFFFSKNLWDKKKLFYLFNTNSFFKKPYGNLDFGLMHKLGTLTDCISFAYYMGYKKIVLVGIDLYDRRYFYLDKNKTSGTGGAPVDVDIHNKKSNVVHQTALNGIIDLVGEISSFLKKKNVNLLLYNKKSLLNNRLKIFKF